MSLGQAAAAVLVQKRHLQVQQVRPGPLPPSGGWITVEACGMCGSDWNSFALRDVPEPFVLGHEIVGVVSEVWGEMATRPGVEVGSRVVLEEAIVCGVCALCRDGRHRLCPSGGRYGKTPLSAPPGLWGGYATAVFLAPGATVHRVPATLPSSLATLFVPISNGISWLRAAAGLRPGESVLVVGVGQHGLATVAAARHLGAGPVIAAGRTGDGARLSAALALGADRAVDTDRQPLHRAVAEVVGSGGVDVLVDVTPGATDVVGAAVTMCAVGGRVVVAGIKHGAPSAIDTDRLYQREITIRGVAARESWAVDAALAWLAANPQTFEPFESMTVGLGGASGALLALGGERGAQRPLHAVVDPRC